VTNARHGWKAKAGIRERVLAEIGPERAIVLDAFAGAGLMWQAVWKHAAGYVGCDRTWHHDGRLCFVADNRRVLRCIDLSPFTIFDLDAFGSPWEAALIIAARRPLRPFERVGLVLTEGSWIATRKSVGKLSTLPPALMQAAGLARTPLANERLHADVISRALQGVARRLGGQIVKRWEAIGTTASRMRYLGVVLERDQTREPA
jgi:hypothetical protein